MLLSFISSELYSLMERSSDAWCIKNIDGKVVYINNVYRKLISPPRAGEPPPLFQFRENIYVHDETVFNQAETIHAFGVLASVDRKVNIPFQCKRVPLFNRGKGVSGLVSHIKPLFSVATDIFINKDSLGFLTCYKPSELFSDKEWDVIYLIMQGYSEKNIAEKLHRSLRTIKFHKTNIFQKTHCMNTTEFTEYAKKQRWHFYLPPSFSTPCYCIVNDRQMANSTLTLC
ncbi:helix-turn-helix domain-containing protein [Enterobacter cloacae]|uniref:response regulator transcription factor n=1 Tax=Enterobacter cloacae TaxID=550 RepID=UPI0034A5406B